MKTTQLVFFVSSILSVLAGRDCQGWTAGSPIVCTYATDRTAINDIYTMMGGTGWNFALNWNVGEDGSGVYLKDPCLDGWFGVFCANYPSAGDPLSKYGTTQTLAFRVETIALTDNNLVGPLPASLYSMNKLVELFMSGNPGITGGLSESITGLVSLQQLQMQDCSLTGPLPNGLNSLFAMRKLYLQGNQLSGAIPNLVGMTGLEDWQMGSNRFVSTLPTYITDMPNLFKFDMKGTGTATSQTLSGTIPLQWRNPNSPLRYIDVSGNGLSGIIPSSSLEAVGSTRSDSNGIQQFYFANNGFSCVFPSFVGNLSRGILFSSDGNRFFCPYPEGIPSQVNDPCIQVTINDPFTINGELGRQNCSKDSSCSLSATGTNFDLECPLVVTASTIVGVGATAVVQAVMTLNSGRTSTSFGVDVAAYYSRLPAGSKNLALQVTMPDGSLFPIQGAQLPHPLFLLGVCNATCSLHGLCNPLAETCLCQTGYFGVNCDQQCQEPFIETIVDPVTGATSTVACSEHGTCAYDAALQSPRCTCYLGPAGENLWDGLYCERVHCDQVDCNEDLGQGVCSRGNCTCLKNTYLEYTGEHCETLNLLADCGVEAGTDPDGDELPAGRGEYNFDISTDVYNCTCSDGWETLTADDGGVPPNCDKKIPPTWPIILGCVIAGVVLIVLGILFFLKFKKFDPEKKRQEMEMQALNS